MSHEFIEKNRSNQRKLSLLLNNIKIKVVYVYYNCYVDSIAVLGIQIVHILYSTFLIF